VGAGAKSGQGCPRSRETTSVHEVRRAGRAPAFPTMESIAILIIVAVFVVAVLYSSVGHGGASGYLAVMAFFAVVPAVTRPTALVLNVIVSAIAFVQFSRQGHFSWRLFWPFAAASIPLAYIGGRIDLSTDAHKVVLGVVLLLAALRLAINLKNDGEIDKPPIAAAMAIGAVIGLVSGLVGVGGGIFLTPVLLLFRWSETRVAAGVSALFILVNSLAGLAGVYEKVFELPTYVYGWLAVTVVGGAIGSTLGAKRFDTMTLRRVLAAVLVVAGIKLILT
jgi:uncharacterized protein